jgi:excisionase family DNA binding protein
LQHYLSRNWHLAVWRGSSRAHHGRIPPDHKEASVAATVPSPASPGFLTIVEAATILRVSKQTVYRLVRAGDLEAVRVGRSVRIPVRVLTRRAPTPPRRA